MNKVIHRSGSRGLAEHGWLHSRHTFNFASYYDPDRMGFGKLRVLNDDIVDSSMGFDTHPHNNMEIVSIPISGTLRHKDSMGNQHIIRSGEVQIMSAGTGITHSEYNDSSTEVVNFLQIWILPKKRNIEPRYEQKEIDTNIIQNKFLQIVTPRQENNDAVWINQDAYFSLSNLEKGSTVNYKCNFENPALYIFIISGEIVLDNEILKMRDGIALDDLTNIEISANAESKVLCIETIL
ncbi:MAG: pirin family protein [Methylococcales bacterium]|nr:pirin family protein [Methylococcales bacterium]